MYSNLNETIALLHPSFKLSIKQKQFLIKIEQAERNMDRLVGPDSRGGYC